MQIGKWCVSIGAAVAFAFAAASPAWAQSDTLASVKQKGKLVAGVKADYKPFGYTDPSGKIVGLEIDLVNDVGRRLGVPVELVPVIAANRMEFLKQGRIDLMIATMAYKHQTLRHCPHDAAQCDFHALEHKLAKTQVNLKLIPHVDGTLAIAQLVAYNLEDITIKGGWLSPARLHLIPHANAPVADLPVRRVVEGRHFIADLSLPYGRVLYDYLREDRDAQNPVRELQAA